MASLNAVPLNVAHWMLADIYEHSPWVAEAAMERAPFKTLAQLKRAMVDAVRSAGDDKQLELMRAHPQLAGKLALAEGLTSESNREQSAAGLKACSAEELAALQRLNAEYMAKFGWPFILAVRGPRGTGLTRQQIIETFARRLENTAAFERAECLRNIHRIAELRLNDKFATQPTEGEQVWDAAELLARYSDADHGMLTVTYLTPAHQACQAQLVRWMNDCGFDEVNVDAVGNVVGVYHGTDPDAQRLLTGSHYDTVRNGGKYDGRLGILVPMACVRELHAQGRRLAHGVELVAFAEEEGQRFRATFLASSALLGKFNPSWLAQQDADGITMREAMLGAGLNPDNIASCERDPSRYVGFAEVHIEQGPVLNGLDMPLGVVTSINGSVRFVGEIIGTASHAGTTPMGQRHDAATAAAELVLYVEKRASQTPHLVGTVGMLEVPQGSINVVPGRCRFSLDIRATTDDLRDTCAREVLDELRSITERRGLRYTVEETMRAAAAPSHPEWQARWEHAVESLGLPVHRLPSGAGHDAMKLHEVMPQAMLFVRGGNSGISHNPLETITADDAQLCVDAFMHLLEHLVPISRTLTPALSR